MNPPIIMAIVIIISYCYIYNTNVMKWYYKVNEEPKYIVPNPSPFQYFAISLLVCGVKFYFLILEATLEQLELSGVGT